MNILYVARHGRHDNDDEGAISHALRELGHRVTCVQEYDAHKIVQHHYHFALFHKFEELHLLENHWPTDKPKCFWYFDLIEHDDFELRKRSQDRKAWAERAIRVFDVGFMTDGDYAAKHSDKLIHLMQGADERVLGAGKPHTGLHPDILFTGTTIHGSKRMQFAREMTAKYGDRFKIIGDRGRSRVHGRELADLMASVPIIVAPDSPVTDLYCSNRVYQALGFGAFLLHPRTKIIEQSFGDGEDLVFYDSRPHLHNLISHYLLPTSTEYRQSIGNSGLACVRKNHLYRHRCEVLINTMKSRFKI